MSASNYVANAIANALANNTSLAVAQLYVKLHVGAPGADGTANAAANTTRKAISFGAAASGVATSDADTIWTNVPSTETYSHISLWDASTAGNCEGTGAMTAPATVQAGLTFELPSGSVTLTVPVG